MNKLFPFALLVMLIMNSLEVFSQTTIRGRVLERFNQQPLPGVTVVLTDAKGQQRPIQSDLNGNFRFDDLVPGRYWLSAQMLGFQPAQAQVVLTSGKEQVVNLMMEESIEVLEEVVVHGKTNFGQASNELVMLSGRSFNADDTRRYAGSLNDPSRMVANYAGVSGANDARNDIIIRGNSPAGLLWRLEGIDIPNPNHFGSLGTTGGPVSMLNNNLLGTSDFITGAFPAAYGNALSGAFDLTLRAGNNERREYVAQVGFNGFELGAEGPLGQNQGSYLVNYRYSTLSLLKGMGVNIGTGAAIPEYQDISYKIVLPTKKTGVFTLFGLAGDSYIELLEDGQAEDNLFSLTGRDTYFGSRSAVFGGSHRMLLSNNWFVRTSLAYTMAGQHTRVDSIVADTEERIAFFGDQLREHRVTLHSQISKKFNARNYFQGGLIANYIAFDFSDSVLFAGRFFPRIEANGAAQLLQGYGQWQHHFSNKLTATGGLHFQYLALNGSFRPEGRVAVRWQYHPGQFLSLAGGMHSQSQPMTLLYYKSPRSQVPGEFTNRDLGFSQSDQLVAGWEYRFSPVWNVKVEAYYQHLSNIPVSPVNGNFSFINAGAEFGVWGAEMLRNEGLGRNRGMELTLERQFSKNWYLMGTGSFFTSEFQGSNGIWHPTAFANRFVANLLTGREFKMGRKSMLSVDARLTWAGGRRYTPIDLEASIARGGTVWDDTRAFSEQFPDYFRADLRITYRINGAKTMQEWAMDFQNLSNRRNVFMQDFNPQTGNIFTVYQVGFFPMMFYRFYF
jgi:hypothetical protein